MFASDCALLTRQRDSNKVVIGCLVKWCKIEMQCQVQRRKVRKDWFCFRIVFPFVLSNVFFICWTNTGFNCVKLFETKKKKIMLRKLLYWFTWFTLNSLVIKYIYYIHIYTINVILKIHFYNCLCDHQLFSPPSPDGQP